MSFLGWLTGRLPGFVDLLRAQAERNIKRIRFGQRFNRNHPKSKHSHSRENLRRQGQFQTEGWGLYHSGTIVLDASTRNVYQEA